MRRSLVATIASLSLLTILYSGSKSTAAPALSGNESKKNLDSKAASTKTVDSKTPETKSAGSKTAETKTAESKTTSKKAGEGKTSSKQALKRADFRVTGASCVTCLRRIGRTMREQPGVLKGDVSIFKPYWAVVVFDANQTDIAKIYASLVREHIKFEDLETKDVTAMPLIVIPKGMASYNSDAAGGAKDTAHDEH